MPAGFIGRAREDDGAGSLSSIDGPCGVSVRANERKGSTEARDVHGTRVRLDRDGVTYGAEFVPFDEMGGTWPAPQSLWNPATGLFEVVVARRNGPDLLIKNLPLQTAERLSAAIVAALGERDA